MNLWTIRTLNSWPLRIEPAHCRVWEGACLLWRNQIDWLQMKRRIAEVTEERAVRLQGEAIFKACVSAALACVVCLVLSSPFALRTYIYIYIYIKSIYLYIFIYIIYLAKSRMEHDHWPCFARRSAITLCDAFSSDGFQWEMLLYNNYVCHMSTAIAFHLNFSIYIGV